MEAESRERLTKLKEKIARGLQVYVRMPDVDARFREKLRGKWSFSVVYEAMDHGDRYDTPWLKHVASPAEVTEMEDVMGWLAWLRRLPEEGDYSVRRIIGWATEVPMSVLAWRERCSVRTIFSRIDASMAKILREFHAVAVDVVAVDEPPDRHEPVTSFTERPAKAGSPDSLLPGKVFIDGEGMMFHGKRYDPEGDAVKRADAHRKRRDKNNFT